MNPVIQEIDDESLKEVLTKDILESTIFDFERDCLEHFFPNDTDVIPTDLTFASELSDFGIGPVLAESTQFTNSEKVQRHKNSTKLERQSLEEKKRIHKYKLSKSTKKTSDWGFYSSKMINKMFHIVTSPGFKRRFGLKRVKQGLITVLCASKIFCTQIINELPNIPKSAPERSEKCNDLLKEMTLVASIAERVQKNLEEISALIAKEEEEEEEEEEEGVEELSKEDVKEEPIKNDETSTESSRISSPFLLSQGTASQDSRKVMKQESFMSQFKGIIKKDQTPFKLASIKQERKKLDHEEAHFSQFEYKVIPEEIATQLNPLLKRDCKKFAIEQLDQTNSERYSVINMAPEPFYEKYFSTREHVNYISETENGKVVCVSIMCLESGFDTSMKTSTGASGLTGSHALSTNALSGSSQSSGNEDSEQDTSSALLIGSQADGFLYSKLLICNRSVPKDENLTAIVGSQSRIDLISPVLKRSVFQWLGDPLSKSNKFKQVPCSKQLVNSLVGYEKSQLVRALKFGLVYCKRGQTFEDDLLSNRKGSKAFDDFCNIIGEKIELANWTGYRGGLRGGMTGTHSVFTTFKGYDIMFHVAPLLPYSTTDRQQIEKKRHIGNDICMVVFKEGNTPIAADFLTSHFTHVVVVVSPVYRDEHYDKEADLTLDTNLKPGEQDPDEDEESEDAPKDLLGYRIEVAVRPDVPKFGPGLPAEGRFVEASRRQELRELILCKLINGELSTYQGAEFLSKFQNTRKQLLKDIFDTYVKKK